MLSAGETGCSFRRDGGPDDPQEEMNSLVVEYGLLVDIEVDGVRKKEETDVVMVSTEAIASENFMVGRCYFSFVYGMK